MQSISPRIFATRPFQVPQSRWWPSMLYGA